MLLTFLNPRNYTQSYFFQGNGQVRTFLSDDKITSTEKIIIMVNQSIPLQSIISIRFQTLDEMVLFFVLLN